MTSKTIPTEEESDLSKQLRALAARIVDVDDHVLIHLAADALSQPTREAVIEEVKEACAASLDAYSKKLEADDWHTLANGMRVAALKLRSLRLPTPEGGSNG